MLRNPQESADLLTFTEEIHNGKLHFLCSVGFLVLDSVLSCAWFLLTVWYAARPVKCKKQ